MVFLFCTDIIIYDVFELEPEIEEMLASLIKEEGAAGGGDDTSGIGSGSPGSGKSKSHYGTLGGGVEDVCQSLPRPISMGRSVSAPVSSKAAPALLGLSPVLEDTGITDSNVSPWLGIWSLLAHPSVYATEPDKQVSAIHSLINF